MMGGPPGRRGAPTSYIFGEGLVRRLDQDAGIIRREREVGIDFEQPLNKCCDLVAASVARFDPERAQERQFEYAVVRKQRCSAFRITDRGEIIQQQSFRVFHLHILLGWGVFTGLPSYGAADPGNLDLVAESTDAQNLLSLADGNANRD